uniref:Ovule protein n=1 Tax=Nippostrongylus brasiliensis TaxID=27835 RepID=A0A0N4XKM4_NIPBR
LLRRKLDSIFFTYSKWSDSGSLRPAGAFPGSLELGCEYGDQWHDEENGDETSRPLSHSCKGESINDSSARSTAFIVRSALNKRWMSTTKRNAFRVKDPSCDIVCQRNLLCSLRMGHHNSTLYCPPASWTSYSLRTNRITP